jgi:xanthine dehydrogenase YagR molybdenum-binding subunit
VDDERTDPSDHEAGRRTAVTDRGDTRYPIGPPSGGSRVTGSLTPATCNAAYRAARDLAARVAPLLQARAEDIVFANGRVIV